MEEGDDELEDNNNVRYWIVNGDRGASADAIVSKMEGITISSIWRNAHPTDPSDFYKCLKLLEAVPEYKNRMYEMAEVSEQWKSLITHWGELEELLQEEIITGRAPKLYNRMKEIGC